LSDQPTIDDLRAGWDRVVAVRDASPVDCPCREVTTPLIEAWFVVLRVVVAGDQPPADSVARAWDDLHRAQAAQTAAQLLPEEAGDFVLDVRTAEEWEAAPRPGAVNVPLGDLPDRLHEVPVARRVVVFCKSGLRAEQARTFLSRARPTQPVCNGHSDECPVPLAALADVKESGGMPDLGTLANGKAAGEDPRLGGLFSWIFGGKGRRVDEEIAVEQFEEPLANYGSWIDDPTYGRLWKPAAELVGDDFAPYASDGAWAANEDGGWVYQSRFHDLFGWATYHYGRWVEHDDLGWVWIPGNEWAPAWVEWRNGGGYVGYVPLGPEGYEHPERHWVFAEERHFGDPGGVWRVRVEPGRIREVLVRAPRIEAHGGHRWSAGPPVERIRKAGGTVQTTKATAPTKAAVQQHVAAIAQSPKSPAPAPGGGGPKASAAPSAAPKASAAPSAAPKASAAPSAAPKATPKVPSSPISPALVAKDPAGARLGTVGDESPGLLAGLLGGAAGDAGRGAAEGATTALKDAVPGLVGTVGDALRAEVPKTVATASDAAKEEVPGVVAAAVDAAKPGAEAAGEAAGRGAARGAKGEAGGWGLGAKLLAGALAVAGLVGIGVAVFGGKKAAS